ILKVKREFLYLLLTLTQEKNVKVSRFPLIYLDETILAHTNLAEFRKFLQESENEALLDRMVIIQVPYTLNYKDEARIYQKLISNAPAFSEVHLDPHVLHVAAVFAILTRLHEDAIESDARIDPKKKRKWVDFLVIARKDFYNKWVKEDVHKALFVSFEQEAQDLLNKYLDEVEATLDNRSIKDPITGEERKADER